MENRSTEDYNNYYIKNDKIGKGGFGEIWKAELKSNDEKKEIRALKFINLKDIRQSMENNIEIDDPDEAMKTNIKNIKKEIENMILCSDKNKNENSVKYYEYFESEDEFVIVMELCDNNLSKILKKKKKFSIDEIYNIMKQLNNTFKIMRKNNFVHRDLKLENILVKYQNGQESDFIVKLCDYGISKKVTDTKICKTHIGTIQTMAPEIIKGEGEDVQYDEKCDLWSIGIILYQLSFGVYPFRGVTETALLKNIHNNRNNVINNNKNTGDKELDDLIINLLKEEPKERITWENYFNHAFFKDKNISEIIIKILVKNEDKDKNGFKDIYFLENINNENKMKEKFNELNKDNTELYINNIQMEFKKFFRPTEEGVYTIKLIIKNKIKSCNNMFYNCRNITSINLTSFKSSEITDTKGMFEKCYNLKEIIFGDFNTEKVINMENMFAKCKVLKKIVFPETFVTKKVTNMALMFFGCENLEELNVLVFDTRNATNMHGLFQDCFLLQKLNLSSFKTDKVTDMSQMFLRCCKLNEIKINPYKFNTIKVVNMSRMFSECSSLKDFKFSVLNTQNVEYMCEMFSKCENFESIDLSSFNTEKLENMNKMFNDCINLKRIDLSSFRDKGDLEKNDLFINCYNLREIKAEQVINKDFENITFKRL